MDENYHFNLPKLKAEFLLAQALCLAYFALNGIAL